MKDSILLGVAIAAFVASAMFFYKTDNKQEYILTNAPANPPATHTKMGAIHDERSDSHGSSTRTRGRQDERVAEHDSEAPQLPSLFEGKSSKSGRRGDRRKAEPGINKVVHGVPTEQWAAERKNALDLAPVTASADAGMRVYLQCMELKKEGPAYVGTGQCESLLARGANGNSPEKAFLGRRY